MSKDERTMDRRISDALDRAEARLDKTGECWIWPGSSNGFYAKIAVKTGLDRGNVMLSLHRALYERHIGAIPEGMEIDHVCRVTMCVNPAHLEAVTHRENARRRTALITHCSQGHEYTFENTYVSAQRKRVCRACGRDRAAAKRRLHQSDNRSLISW